MDLPRPKAPAWFAATKVFETPSRSRALFQLADTLLPFVGLGVVAALLEQAGVPWYFLLPLVPLAGLFMVRIFILFHDCCHGSFWSSRSANTAWGWLLGTLVFTPFKSWRKSHGAHHAHNANLDRRGVGDVWTMTLAEYRAASPGLRWWYRFYRHPAFLFLLSPPLLFLFAHRVPERNAAPAEMGSVHLTTALSALLMGAVGWLAGWGFLLWYVLPTLSVASMAGVWLFYVQHQFDPGYWAHEEDWDPYKAALEGSSFYRLPRWAQWFSANIGFHHIHHLRPRIPNYRLEECWRAVKELQLPHPLTWRSSWKGLNLHLWDEGGQRLLSFRPARLL